MPCFERVAISSAPPEEVWKLLYDPARFPLWWDGFETVTDVAESDETKAYTLYPTGYPDYPMPQKVRSTKQGSAVVVSCLHSDLEFSWRLEPLDDGLHTQITVHVEIPDAEAHRLQTQETALEASITRLAELAAQEYSQVG
jgi:uncharacterized protein YndB with AHSA1/START domain